MKKKRITTRDIAKSLDLHFTTVAEALRNSKRISERTRKRVREEAKRLGYRPDPMLSALNAYRSGSRQSAVGGSIAWINSFEDRDIFETNGFYGSCYQAAKSRAKEVGYSLEVFWLGNPRMKDRRASEILYARGIRGLIVPPQDEEVRILEFDWSLFSAVRIGQSLRSPALPAITSDQKVNAITLYQFLAKKGFSCIGYACPRWIDERVLHGFSAGYLAAQQAFFHGKKAIPLFDDSLDPKTSVRFVEWIRSHQIDALMCHTHDDYESVLKASGLRVPEDITFAWMSLSEDDLRKPGMMENGHEIGRFSVDLVVAMINRGEVGVPQTPPLIGFSGVLNRGDAIQNRKSKLRA